MASLECTTATRTIEEATKCALDVLSPELLREIFKTLDRASSTCLGLTCKAFYQVHWELRGRVPLHSYAYLPFQHAPAKLSYKDYFNRTQGIHLYHLLGEWKGDLVLGMLPPPYTRTNGRATGKLVTKERRAKLLKGFGMEKSKDMEGSSRWRISCSAARDNDAPEAPIGLWKKGKWVKDGV